MRTQPNVRRLFPAVLSLVALFVIACTGGQPATDSRPSLAQVEELADGVLDVIVFPMVDEPFVAPNLDAGILPLRSGVGQLEGIDIDIMVAFAQHLGVEVAFLRLESPGFGDLIPALVEGQGDMIASALTINEKRDAIIDFSRPYFTVSTVIVTRTDVEIAQFSDLEGKVGVGVRGGLPNLLLHARGFNGELIEADFQTGLYADVADGQADFAIMESASARAGLAARPGLKIAFSFPERDNYGFATREGSELTTLIDAFLDQLEASGTLERIMVDHLGPAPIDP